VRGSAIFHTRDFSVCMGFLAQPETAALTCVV
jgi:hypothetical protein